MNGSQFTIICQNNDKPLDSSQYENGLPVIAKWCHFSFTLVNDRKKVLPVIEVFRAVYEDLLIG